MERRERRADRRRFRARRRCPPPRIGIIRNWTQSVATGSRSMMGYRNADPESGIQNRTASVPGSRFARQNLPCKLPHDLTLDDVAEDVLLDPVWLTMLMTFTDVVSRLFAHRTADAAVDERVGLGRAVVGLVEDVLPEGAVRIGDARSPM